jgi:hypothetical protein
MNQRDATIDVGPCRLAARCLQVRLPDVPEIGSGVIVVMAMRMRLREKRERSGKNEREQDTNGEPPCFQREILAPLPIRPPMRRFRRDRIHSDAFVILREHIDRERHSARPV